MMANTFGSDICCAAGVLDRLIFGRSPEVPLSYLTYCINQAATICIIDATPAVANTNRIIENGSNRLLILGIAARSLT
jgi:hypothetical protein